MNTENMEETVMEKKEYGKIVTIVVLFLAVAGTGFGLLGSSNMEIILRFYLLLLILGLAVLPVSFCLFPSFQNGGYFFSKIAGLFISGYLMWLFSSLNILKFSLLNCFICLFIVILLVYGITIYRGFKLKYSSFMNSLKQKWFYILLAEIFFLFLFLFFIYLLGNKIPGVETEKSMDYAFMSTLMRTEYMPPLDMWASGKTLNYYYFGQYIMTFLTKISFVKVQYGYSLSMAVIGAFCFVLVVNLVYEMARHLFHNKKWKTQMASLAALLSGIAVTFSGNMHYFIFAKVTPAIWDMLKIPGEKPMYWFADSTRYIGYTPDVAGDKTIAEFPFYSFIIGDLHAHVIDIMVVLTIVALLFSYFIRIKNEEMTCKWYQHEIFCPQLLMIGFLIGIACMTNYWDYPIYFVVSGSVVLAFNGLQYHFKGKTFYTTAIQGLMIFVIAQLISLPFSLKFEEMIMGIRFATTHSQFYQLCILWGFPVIMVVCAIVALLRKKINRADLFCLLLGACAIGLVIIPEVIYVRDIYEEGFPRANTMFKLTYEAFILFGITLGYLIIRFLRIPEKKWQRKTGIFGLVCLCLTTGYFFTASKMWLGNYWNHQNFKGIDATVYFSENMAEDMGAITFIEENIEGQPVILEADGDSYTNYERVAVLTGMPTVLGWHTHEWLWRNGYLIVEERQADITNIYTGNNKEYVKEILDQYEVSYIFIGSKEYEKYPEMNVSFLEGLGEVVYQEYQSESGHMTEIIKIR